MAKIMQQFATTEPVTLHPEFVSATGRDGDPVGRIGDDWGFWDEVWCDWHGGFADKASAEKGLSDYVRDVLGE
ncbi:hypothetical protein [Erythrobacter aureus]|uniref:Uncharacterized protein n=1 Tax=Erythrobacter aureus TaxID=2182384 RepID=A0A345YIV8_9SPHN|nr:hypothetical protein [Erythrobacter aureus]AXK43860.1 hypothetical protein DVR09_15510 [Erythrobacter aureus]